MVICKNTDCVFRYCCIECDTHNVNTCCCVIAEELSHDKDEILSKCEHADEI